MKMSMIKLAVEDLVERMERDEDGVDQQELLATVAHEHSVSVGALEGALRMFLVGV